MFAASQTGFAKEDALDYLPRKSAIEYAKGMIICSQDNGPVGLFLVLSGRVAIIGGRGNGSETVLRIAGPQQLFGDVGARTGPLNRRTIALDRVTIMHWTAEELKTLTARVPRLGISLLHDLVRYSRDLQDRLTGMAQLQTPQRVACAIAHLAGRLGAEMPDGSWRMPGLTHQMLAAYIGTSREIVTCEMNRLRRQGLVRYTRNFIEVYLAAVRDLERYHWQARDTATSAMT